MPWLKQLTLEQRANLIAARKVFVIDLDGTLFDGTHRVHLLPKGDGATCDQWVEFNKACVDDTPIRANIEMVVLALAKDPDLVPVIVTGRGEQARAQTEECNAKHLPYCLKYAPLIMRPADDHRTARHFKDEVFRWMEATLIIDDDPAIIALAAEMNIPYIQVPSLCAAVQSGKAGAGQGGQK
ncbi:acid phosphatase [Vibrio phage 1.077.O._10N.261.45.A10]|nr:acid phosphatase [Vibrio phage 1.070.O._10N.261.45.B2]AUR85611.1 acid phosphatase [Vibrio phage 1.077.O._10N.261.45.A10]